MFPYKVFFGVVEFEYKLIFENESFMFLYSAAPALPILERNSLKSDCCRRRIGVERGCEKRR